MSVTTIIPFGIHLLPFSWKSFVGFCHCWCVGVYTEQRINSSGGKKWNQKEPLSYSQSKRFLKIILVILVLCRHSLKLMVNNLPRYLLNYRRRFMYLQTLGFLTTQLPKVPERNQKTFSAQNLSSRIFCNEWKCSLFVLSSIETASHLWQFRTWTMAT